MRDYRDKEILEGIINHDSSVLNHLYDTCYPKIQKMILKKGGNEGDAKDIFQDTMIILYRKLKEEKLELSCKLNTYIFAICKNLWIQEYKSNKYKLKVSVDTVDVVNEPSLLDKFEPKLLEIYDRHFMKLSKKCQKILKLHFKGKKISEIRKAMKYDSDQYTMDRKYRCKSSLIRRIMNDPEFKEINDEIKEESNPVPGRDAE